MWWIDRDKRHKITTKKSSINYTNIRGNIKNRDGKDIIGNILVNRNKIETIKDKLNSWNTYLEKRDIKKLIWRKQRYILWGYSRPNVFDVFWYF